MKIEHRKRPWIKEGHRHNERSGDRSFYQTKEWRATRNSFLMANPWCVDCEKEGKKGKATVADHIEQVIKGGEKLNWNNLQGLCDHHHNARSARQRNEMYKKS